MTLDLGHHDLVVQLTCAVYCTLGLLKGMIWKLSGSFGTLSISIKFELSIAAFTNRWPSSRFFVTRKPFSKRNSCRLTFAPDMRNESYNGCRSYAVFSVFYNSFRIHIYYENITYLKIKINSLQMLYNNSV